MAQQGAGERSGDIVVRKAVVEDIPRLSEVLARAFDADPAANWFCLQDRRRAERMRELFDVYLRRISMPEGEVYTTSELGGAALWAPPGRWPPGFSRELRLLPAMARVAGARHLIGKLQSMRPVSEQHPAAPHWYLQVLGTEPALQGQGIGTALIRPVLDTCDRTGTPAYLETAKEGNIPFYERRGFKVTGEIKGARGAPRVWLMWRDPA